MRSTWLKSISKDLEPIALVVTAGNVTLTNTEGLVLVLSAEATNITITLPKSPGNKAIFVIFRLPGNSTTLTVDANGTELIGEALTTVLTEDYESVTLISNNPNVVEPNSTLSSSWKIDNLFGDVMDPTVVSATATDANTIRLVFDSSMGSVTTAGWSFKQGGSPITPDSVTGATDTWDFVFSETMVDTDTLLRTYNSSTGGTTDLAGNELASFTDQAVVNSI